MKTTISFWLGKYPDEKDFFTIYDVDYNPFQLGDKFWFEEEELWPKTISDLSSKFRESFVDSIIQSTKDRQSMRGKYKIIQIHTSLKHDPNMIDREDFPSYKLSVEIHIKKIRVFYWWQLKFWNNYKFKQFFKNLKNKRK
jgi:hypothetical protein